MAYGYAPTNAGWGAAATYAKQQPRATTVYTPTNPGWGNAATAAKLAALNPSGTTTLGWTTEQGNQYAGKQNQGPSYYGGSAPSYNWENDPFLMQTKALIAKSRTEAEATKNDSLRKSILSSGIGALAEKLFGGDTAFIQSVKDNPFSGMGEIRNMYEGVTGKINQTNEALNQDNLFFSSYRTGTALPAVYRERQGDEYDLTNQTQSAIDSVNAAYANKLDQLQMQELQAQQEAWMRAMQSGAYGGYGPSSGGGGGPGGGGGDPANGARPGEWADLPLLTGWEPWRNTDATYDMSGATPDGYGGYIGPQGQRYDEKGRVR